MTTKSNKAKTGVFWNIDDCPIPEGHNPRNIFENIKSSLADEGYHGEVSVWAYCGQGFHELWSHYNHAGIILRTSVGVGIVQVNHMIMDILLFGMRNPAPLNVMSDDVESEALLDIVSIVFHWPKQSDVDKESDEVMSDSDVVA